MKKIDIKLSLIFCNAKRLVMNFGVLSLTFLVFLTSLQCSSKKVYLKNGSRQESSYQNSNLAENNKVDIITEMDNAESWIEETSRKFDLQNLKNKRLLEDEIEIRIWAGVSPGIVLNCFILRGKNNKWEATLFYVDADDKGLKKNKQGKFIVNKKILSEPKSSWETVNNYLMEKGVRVPLPYMWDEKKQFAVYDEGSVSLEIKKWKNYNLISYGELTKTSDGKTVIEVCNYLGSEFGIELGCGN